MSTMESDEEQDNDSCSACENTSTFVLSGEKFCDDCFDIKFFNCASCYETTERSFANYTYHGTEIVCQDCFEQNYFMCDSCHDYKHDDDSYHFDEDGVTWCERCCDHYAYWCSRCETRHREGYNCTETDLINNYTYRPNLVFRMLDPNGNAISMSHESPVKDNRSVFMGFELEVEEHNGDLTTGAGRFQEVIDDNFIYLKEDGSLDCGFEIVTHPSTLAYYHSMRERWSEPIDGLRSGGFRSWNTKTCGMHVHVSREAFDNKAHLWRFAYFMNSNPLPLQKLAGRKSDQWASFEGQKYESSKIIAGKRFPESRYVAVNLSNRDTVEIRIFRGSLMPRRVMSNLALVDSIVEYTRRMTVKEVNDGMTSWRDYERFVRNLDAPMYADLQYYIKHYFGLGESTEITQEG